MGRHTLYHFSPNGVRNSLNNAVQKADEIHRLERELVEMMMVIDRHRFFVRYGYKSLRGFCINGLKFSKTQAQRIVTEVRRQGYQSD